MLTIKDFWNEILAYCAETQGDTYDMIYEVDEKIVGEDAHFGFMINDKASLSIFSFEDKNSKPATHFNDFYDKISETWPREGGLLRRCGRTVRVSPSTEIIGSTSDENSMSWLTGDIVNMSIHNRKIDDEWRTVLSITTAN